VNVLLLNPPFHPRFSREQRSPAVTKGGTFYYPMWLAYATGVLERAGFNVKLVDAPADGKDLQSVLDVVKDFRPGLVVLDTSTPSIHNDVQVTEAIKEVSRDVVAILVGPHVSALPTETLTMSTRIDAVARGEYDFTILDCARRLSEGGSLAGIEGLTYRQNGETIHNPARPFIEDLDALPFVSRVYKQHLNVGQYFYAHGRYPIVVTVAGRGCPFQCTYCVYPQTFVGRKYRARGIDNVIDELQFVREAFPHVKEVMFEDDTLTVNRNRVRDLCARIVERRLNIEWSANSRPDLDYETLRMMKEAGCRLLCVGMESGDQTILDRIKKKMTVEKIRQFVADARKAKVLVHGCFMFGNPGETEQTIRTTIELAKDLPLDTAQFFPLMVYPGTESYDWMRGNGYLRSEDFRQWLTPEGLHNCMIDLPGLSAERLVEWCDRARRAFYLRPRYILAKLIQGLGSVQDAKKLMRSSRSFFRHLFLGTYKLGER